MGNISITKRDGTKAAFDADNINRSIERACAGLSDWLNKVTTIATETQLTLYNGVTTKELDEATINAALQNVKEDPDYDIVATRLLLKTVYKQVLGDYDADDVEAVQQLHIEKFAGHIKDQVEDKLFDQRMLDNYDLEKLATVIDVARDSIFRYAGLSTMLNRYTVKSDTGDILETPQYFFMRVAMGLAFNEENPTEWAIKFYNKMSNHLYIAGGSTNVHAGTTRPSLSNCFLMEMHDDMEHISKSVSDVMMLSKASGGIGLSVTKLRASGSPIKGTGGSTGPVTFSKIVDVAIRAIQRGGKKKGALAIYMETWHLDFPDFIDWRHNAGDEHLRMRTANTAAYISDEFMKRVKNSDDWYMFDPKETPDLNELYGAAFSKRYKEYIEMAEAGELRTFKKSSANGIFNKMIVSLQGTSHPWQVWKDPINVRAINNNTGTIHMSNLCTEICLPQDKENIAVCNLASLNIVRHFENGDINWQKLEDSVRTCIRQLDDLVDINDLPIPEAEKSDKENRAVGMGVMGIADAVERLGFAYDSEESYDFVDRVLEFVSYMAIDESATLAETRGSYKNFEGSRWSQGMVPIDTLDILEKERGIPLLVDKSSKHGGLNWDTLRIKVKKGMRNATLMAVAPNANIGLVAGTTPGFDPRFAQVFSRNKISGKYLDINTNLVNKLKGLNLWERVQKQIIQSQGDISAIEEIPQEIRDVYKTSFSTDPIGFVKVGARAQKWIDQAISRNMYFETRNTSEIMEVYMSAWEHGLKSTYYCHMKPRHTSEQSTTKVNKAASIGKVGFAALRAKATPVVEKVPAPKTEPVKTKVMFATTTGVSEKLPEDPADRLQCDDCQ